MTRNMQTNARFKHTPEGLLDLGPASTTKQIMGITSRTIKVGSIILFEYFEHASEVYSLDAGSTPPCEIQQFESIFHTGRKLSQSSKTQRPSDELMHTLNPSHKARKVDCRHEQSEEATIEQRCPTSQSSKKQKTNGEWAHTSNPSHKAHNPHHNQKQFFPLIFLFY